MPSNGRHERSVMPRQFHQSIRVDAVADSYFGSYLAYGYNWHFPKNIRHRAITVRANSLNQFLQIYTINGSKL